MGKRRILLMIGLGILGGVITLYETLSNKEPRKYSAKWIENLNDEQWEIERETVRKKFCNPEYDDVEREGFHNILNLFDRIKSDRDWGDEEPKGPAYHREHGWYLPNDDD